MRYAASLFLLLPLSAANVPSFSYQAPTGATITAIVVDPSGNTIVTGTTSSTTFPTTPDALQSSFKAGTCYTLYTPGGPFIEPCSNAFLIKLDPYGNVLFSTYFGGNGSLTTASALTTDANGNIFLAGTTLPISEGQFPTGAPDYFPVTSGAAFIDPNTNGSYLAKLTPNGQLIYATFLPIFPNVPANALAVAIDAAGNAYIAANTQVSYHPASPATPGAFQTAPLNNSLTGVVVKIDASGSHQIYGTYLGGKTWDVPQGIAVDSSGNAYVTGSTASENFPTTAGAFQPAFPAPNGYVGFVTKLNPTGTVLVYSTFDGVTADSDNGFAGPWNIKVDSQGGAFVLGHNSALSHLSADGSSQLYSIPMGAVTGLDLDSFGNAYVAGTTGAGGIITTPGAFQPDSGGGFVMKITPAGQIAGATYLGASATAIALAPNGSVAVAAPNSVTGIFPAVTILNAASYAPGAVAAGEIVAIRAYGFGPTPQVFFDEFAAPVLYSDSQQINVQVPFEVAGRPVTQLRAAQASASVPVQSALPGIFYVNNSDGTRNAPTNPAHAGDFIAIYGTGGGVTNPSGITGAYWPASLSTLLWPATVTVGGENAAVLYAGSAPTLLSGFFQVNAKLPSDLAATTANLVINVGGSASVPVTISLVAHP